MDDTRSMAVAVKTALLERGLTSKAAAEELGIGEGTFSRKLNGTLNAQGTVQKWTVSEAKVLAGLLGIPVETLLGGPQ